jgi:hypothetical protein
MDIVVGKHLLKQIIRVSGVRRQFASFRQIDRQLFYPVNIMDFTGGKSKLCRYSIRSDCYMNFKAVKIRTLGSTISSIIFSLYDFRPSNTDSMANCHRKNCRYCKLFAGSYPLSPDLWICNFTGQEFLIRGDFYFFCFFMIHLLAINKKNTLSLPRPKNKNG